MTLVVYVVRREATIKWVKKRYSKQTCSYVVISLPPLPIPPLPLSLPPLPRPGTRPTSGRCCNAGRGSVCRGNSAGTWKQSDHRCLVYRRAPHSGAGCATGVGRTTGGRLPKGNGTLSLEMECRTVMMVGHPLRCHKWSVSPGERKGPKKRRRRKRRKRRKTLKYLPRPLRYTPPTISTVSS